MFSFSSDFCIKSSYKAINEIMLNDEMTSSFVLVRVISWIVTNRPKHSVTHAKLCLACYYTCKSEAYLPSDSSLW